MLSLFSFTNQNPNLDKRGKDHKRKIQIYAYANNHYAGHGPATVEILQDIWRRQVKEKTKSGKAETLSPM
jgi:hypothetical protein